MNYAWEPLASGVQRCRLPFLDVTVGLVHGPSQVLLIDCGTTLSEASRIAEDVLELTGERVSDVVLTHCHFDHTLGSAGFPDARIYAAKPVFAAMSTGREELREDALRFGADSGEVARAIAGLRPPDHLIDRTVFTTGDRTVLIEHPGPGHTDHDLVVVVPPRSAADRIVVFCGDLVEESADPVIGSDSNLAAWPDALGRLLDLGGARARYVPGHGAVVSAEFVVRQRDWLLSRAAEIGLT